MRELNWPDERYICEEERRARVRRQGTLNMPQPEKLMEGNAINCTSEEENEAAGTE